MKTVGIIGGIGPESTIVYYRAIIALHAERKLDGSNPSIIINSIDLKKMFGLIGANDLAGVTEYFVCELEKLARAGADFAALSSNTPHIVFDDIRRRSPLPLISIVEETCKVAVALSVKEAALLGTTITMQGGFYPTVFSPKGVTIVLPQHEEQEYVHHKYLTEFVPGIFLPETRARLLQIIQQMIQRDGIDAVILGGTELALILRPEDVADLNIPFLDTAQIHAEAIVGELLSR